MSYEVTVIVSIFIINHSCGFITTIHQTPGCYAVMTCESGLCSRNVLNLKVFANAISIDWTHMDNKPTVDFYQK